MCGIAGWIRPDHDLNVSHLKKMTDAISHRGPDGDGQFVSTAGHGAWQLALGHRRLAIIDPAAGHQPMRSADGRYTLVFNGEVYNFRELRRDLEGLGGRFATDSDTEVLLEAWSAWGPDCLTRLRGMFAFALWDDQDHMLVLARDRFGKKPLFLAPQRNGFAFASEIKALLSLPGMQGHLDPNVLSSYLLYRYAPGPETFFGGIVKLQPGHCAIWRKGQLSTFCYYQPPAPGSAVSTLNKSVLIEEYRERLEDSVRARLVSDVPFGAFLSGGIDSSAIVALMSKLLDEPVKTFSIGFEGDKSSELPAASVVARHCGSLHTELVVSADEIHRNLDDAIRACDAPISEPASIAILLLSREASRHVKMVLSGEGADETVGGYAKHSMERFAHHYQRAPAFLREAARRVTAHTPLRMAKRLAASLETLAIADDSLRHAVWFGGFSVREIEAMTGATPRAAPLSSRPQSKPSQLGGLLLFDQLSWLPDNLLERGDRMTMAASIEARMPFMDHELIEFTSQIPDFLKIRGLTGKWILRQSIKDLLPPSVLGRRKRGFPMPVAEWFRGPLRQQLEETILDRRSVSRSLVGEATIADLLKAHHGGADRSKALWQLFNLDRFCQLYGLGA